jgi:hypothetical protein
MAEKPESCEVTPEAPSINNSASSSMKNTPNFVHGSQDEPPQALEVKKIPFWKRALAKLGFNPMVVMFMVKGALAPTICMAMYQKLSLAVHYLNLGYLMIIISILTVPILPRGKFLMNLLISLVRNSKLIFQCR